MFSSRKLWCVTKSIFGHPMTQFLSQYITIIESVLYPCSSGFIVHREICIDRCRKWISDRLSLWTLEPYSQAWYIPQHYCCFVCISWVLDFSYSLALLSQRQFSTNIQYRQCINCQKSKVGGVFCKFKVGFTVGGSPPLSVKHTLNSQKTTNMFCQAIDVIFKDHFHQCHTP